MKQHHPPRKQIVKKQHQITAEKLEICGNSFTKKPIEKPLFEKRISLESQVSLVSDRSDITPVYKQVKTLVKDLLVPDENLKETESLSILIDKTTDLTCRDIDHEIPKKLQSAIEKRFIRNVGSVSRYRFDAIVPDHVGLEPNVPIPQMLALLKAQEKFLLIQEWKEYWNQIRRPSSKWYERKDSTFNAEVRKCREFLVDSNKPKEEFYARLALLDLQRNLYMESEIHH